MQYINPDDAKELVDFYRTWKSNYPDQTRGKGKDKITTSGLKPPTLQSLRTLYQYATNGDIPGENITAMLQNELYATFNTSPLEELDFIPSTIQYITTYLPCEAWGNPEKFGKWINNKKRGKIGKPTDFY
jgi:hypothetical protein